jgi:hypothetical protein
MSDDMWWPWPPTEYFTQKEEFERDLSDQMRRMIADLDRIFPLLMAPSLRPLLNGRPSALECIDPVYQCSATCGDHVTMR